MTDQPAYVISKFLKNLWVDVAYGWDREKTIRQASEMASSDHPTAVHANSAKHTLVYQSDRDLIDAQE